MNEPINLFKTKHFWAVVFTFYTSILYPSIDKAFDQGLTKKDIGHLINASVLGLLAAATKILDPNVYTNKILPGTDLEEALNNVALEKAHIIMDSKIQENFKGVTSFNATIPAVAPLISVLPSPNSIVNKIVSNNNIPTVEKSNIKLVTTHDTSFKSSTVNSVLGDNSLFVKANTTVYIKMYKVDKDNHLLFTTIDDKSLYAFIPHIKLYIDDLETKIEEVIVEESNPNSFIPSKEQCNELYDTELTEGEYKDLLRCLNTFNITSKLDVAHFLAQIGHESAGLRYTAEIATGEDYEYREDLGNTQEGDGPKYKGAGFIQLTGRSNYQAFSNHMKDSRIMEGVNYVGANYAFTSAGFWWYNNDMSSYINNEGATIEQVSKAVNGGTNGLEDRQFYYQKAKQIFNMA